MMRLFNSSVVSWSSVGCDCGAVVDVAEAAGFAIDGINESQHTPQIQIHAGRKNNEGWRKFIYYGAFLIYLLV